MCRLDLGTASPPHLKEPDALCKRMMVFIAFTKGLLSWRVSEFPNLLPRTRAWLLVSCVMGGDCSGMQGPYQRPSSCLPFDHSVKWTTTSNGSSRPPIRICVSPEVRALKI